MGKLRLKTSRFQRPRLAGPRPSWPSSQFPGPAPRRDVTKKGPKSLAGLAGASQPSPARLSVHRRPGAGPSGGRGGLPGGLKRQGACALGPLPPGGRARRAFGRPREGGAELHFPTCPAGGCAGAGGPRRRGGGAGCGGRAEKNARRAAAPERVERSGAAGGGGGVEEEGGPGPSRASAEAPGPSAPPTPGPSAAAMARPLVPSSQKALLLELKGLQEEPVEGFRVTLVDEGDLYNWEVAIFGPPNTYYEGGYFKVSPQPTADAATLSLSEWSLSPSARPLCAHAGGPSVTLPSRAPRAPVSLPISLRQIQASPRGGPGSSLFCLGVRSSLP